MNYVPGICTPFAGHELRERELKRLSIDGFPQSKICQLRMEYIIMYSGPSIIILIKAHFETSHIYSHFP